MPAKQAHSDSAPGTPAEKNGAARPDGPGRHDQLKTWIARIALGERHAFDNLYAATAPALYATAYRILGDRSEAEDAIQETYVKIWRNAGAYGPTHAAPMSWLIAITRNTAIDRLRRRRETTMLPETFTELPDDAPTPEAAALASSEALRIQECLDELEPTRATLIRRAFFTGQTYHELARSMETPLGTIKSWIRRSLITLKDCLDPDDSEQTRAGERHDTKGRV